MVVESECNPFRCNNLPQFRHTSRPPVCKYVLGDGGLENVLALLNGFDVAMDEPFMLIYEEVTRAPTSTFLPRLDPQFLFNLAVRL